MPHSNIALQRLSQQRLTQNPFATPAEVVSWLGAAQAQDYLGAKWSLGMRVAGATDETIERAFNDGAILRTHLMRPTWHFVTPADIHWIQSLTGPRVNAGNAHRYRELELDESLLRRCSDLIARALEGGRQLTRTELAAVLNHEGIAVEGQRLPYILHRAELDGVACSGPRRGKQFTYMLLAERVSRARSLPRDEALAELTRRYYTGHGPATVRDFSWWSGLTIADVKAGIAMLAADLASVEIEGTAYYYSAVMPPAAQSSRDAFLLPTYDEYVIGYANFNRSRTAGQELGNDLIFDSTIVYAGVSASVSAACFTGTWRRTFRKECVVVELTPFASFTTAEEEAIAGAAKRYGKFLGMPVEYSIV